MIRKSRQLEGAEGKNRKVKGNEFKGKGLGEVRRGGEKVWRSECRGDVRAKGVDERGERQEAKRG